MRRSSFIKTVSVFIRLLLLNQGVAQEVFELCFEKRNILFIYVTEAVNFTTATDDCVARGATLARISDDEAFDFAREFMDNTSLVDINARIGIFSLQNVRVNKTCTRFSKPRIPRRWKWEHRKIRIRRWYGSRSRIFCGSFCFSMGYGSTE